jgi:hypothetical protein
MLYDKQAMMTAPIWVIMETAKLLEKMRGARSKTMAKTPQISHRATFNGLKA